MVEAEGSPTTWKFTQYVYSLRVYARQSHGLFARMLRVNLAAGRDVLTLTGASATKAMLKI
jgi:hypothetical protein